MSSASNLRPSLVAALIALACIVPNPAAARDSRGGPRRQPAVQTVEPEVTEPSGTWTAGTAPAADCTRARRKLWRAEQGWIVKTVTTCH